MGEGENKPNTLEGLGIGATMSLFYSLLNLGYFPLKSELNKELNQLPSNLSLFSVLALYGSVNTLAVILSAKAYREKGYTTSIYGNVAYGETKNVKASIWSDFITSTLTNSTTWFALAELFTKDNHDNFARDHLAAVSILGVVTLAVNFAILCDREQRVMKSLMKIRNQVEEPAELWLAKNTPFYIYLNEYDSVKDKVLGFNLKEWLVNKIEI